MKQHEYPTCATCIYFDPEDHETGLGGLCRYDAPAVPHPDIDRRFEGVWTGDDDWCGKWIWIGMERRTSGAHVLNEYDFLEQMRRFKRAEKDKEIENELLSKLTKEKKDV